MKKITMTLIMAILAVTLLSACSTPSADAPSALATTPNATGQNYSNQTAEHQPEEVLNGQRGNSGNGNSNQAAQANTGQPLQSSEQALHSAGQAQEFVATGELSEAEIAALNFMREEEKLAQDVYLALADLWGQQVFANIAQSEAMHMDSILAILDAYGLPDPAAGNAAGVFSDPALQALYDELVARGNQSLAEALKVGAEIEEIDILDLQARIAQTSNTQIQAIYNNLLEGSYNHLRSFVQTLQNQTGETYQPQHMTLEAYQLVLSESNGRRGGQGGGQGQGQGGGQGQGQGKGQGGNGGQGNYSDTSL